MTDVAAPAPFQIDALAAQAEILDDTTSDNLLFVGGMGASKTWTMALKSMLLSAANHPYPVYVYEPTFPMVRKILLPTYEEMFSKLGVRWGYHKTEHVIRFRHDDVWSRIHLDSGEEPDKLVGPTVAAVLIDEAGKQKPGVWEKLPTRVRHPGARVLQFCAFGTPEDFGPFYQWCEGAWDEMVRGTRHVVHAETTDNIFLPPSPEEYVRKRFGQLSPEDFDRYVRGRFVPLGQRVYAFDRRRHGRATVMDPFRGEILVGCDFNFGKMCWVVGTRQGDHIHFFAELVRHRTTTWDQAVALVDLLRRQMDLWRHRPAGYGSTIEEACQTMTAYVDPSARNRSVRAYESDVEQMKRAGVRRVVHEDGIIPVRDRVSSMNWRLREDFITIDVEACPELVKSLEMQGYDAAGEPKKGEGEGDLSGAVDAAGYLVWGIPTWRASLPQGNSLTYSTYV